MPFTTGVSGAHLNSLFDGEGERNLRVRHSHVGDLYPVEDGRHHLCIGGMSKCCRCFLGVHIENVDLIQQRCETRLVRVVVTWQIEKN